MSTDDSTSKKIGDYEFRVYKLPWREGQAILIDLLHVIGPTLGKAADTFGSRKLLDVRLDDPGVAAVLATAVRGLTQDRMNSLVETMAKFSHVKLSDKIVPLEAVLDEVFRGNLLLLYGWLYFALRVNYENFFDSGLLASVGLGQVIPQSSSDSAKPRSQPAKNG